LEILDSLFLDELFVLWLEVIIELESRSSFERLKPLFVKDLRHDLLERSQEVFLARVSILVELFE